MSGSTVKNHISFKKLFEYSVIRKTSYQSWFLVSQRVLPQVCLLQHSRHHQRKLIFQITLQQSCQAIMWIDKYGETRILMKTSQELLYEPTKIPKSNKNKNHEQVRETGIIPTYGNGCKISVNLVDEKVLEHRGRL